MITTKQIGNAGIYQNRLGELAGKEPGGQNESEEEVEIISELNKGLTNIGYFINFIIYQAC